MRLALRLAVDLEPLVEGWPELCAAGVGLDGAVHAVARRSATGEQLVVRWHAGRVRTARVPPLGLDPFFVQPVGDDLLLAGARCAWRPKGAEKNAVIVDWSGRELARLTLGDGIQDVRAAPDGALWVSYFDEGIFGNRGWSGPGPPAIGSPGLVAFTRTGEVRFAYDAAAARTDPICDAYAINVAGDGDLWAYFYMDFPIVRIRRGGHRVWQLGAGCARALAVRDGRALLLGDYRRPGVVRLVELGPGRKARIVDDGVLVDDRDQPVGDARAWGVGPDLFVLAQRRVLVTDGW